MNKTQWGLRLELVRVGIPAAFASLAVVLGFFLSLAIQHYLSGQPSINLILLITANFIIGSLTIVLARHIILFHPASISSGFWINSAATRSRVNPESFSHWLNRNHRKKELLLPGF